MGSMMKQAIHASPFVRACRSKARTEQVSEERTNVSDERASERAGYVT